MKFLQAVVLSASCMGYVTASHPDYTGYLGLRKAIDEGRLDIAVDLVKQDEELGEVGVKYVIRKHNDPDLIASFANQTNQANASTLDELGRESSIETRKKVLEKVVFPQQALVAEASSYASYPETFLVFLNKIVKPEDQEKAVEKGIEKLVYTPIATSRLLNALKGKTFRSERLEYIAIQKAFMVRVRKSMVDNLPTDICNHAAITPELYADALSVTAGFGKYSPTRKLLLKQADRYDLEAVKEKPGYADLDLEFRSAIEGALKTAAPGGTRTRAYDIQTVEEAAEVFDELGSSGISEDVFSIVGEAVMRDPPKKRSQTVSTKAAEKVASDVTSTSTKIEGSGDIGGERVGEDQT